MGNFEFHKLGSFKDDVDLYSFLKGNGENRQYDSHECMMLKSRLLQCINALRISAQKEFNWLELPGYIVGLNMPCSEHATFTDQGPSSVIPISEGNKYPRVIPERKKKII